MCLDTATKPVQVEGVFTRVHPCSLWENAAVVAYWSGESQRSRRTEALTLPHRHASQNSRYRYYILCLSVLSLIGSPAVGSGGRRNCGFPSVENPELSQMFSL